MMFYDHIAVPPYIEEKKLPEWDGYWLQIVGDLRGRCKAQRAEMFRNGFWPDTSKYLLLKRGDKTIAWLGFARQGRGVVIVKQIQGAIGEVAMPKVWPEKLLECFLVILDRDIISTVCIRPARTHTWFNCDDEKRQGRLITYYDRIPSRMGFVPANREAIDRWRFMTHDDRIDNRVYRPHHKLKLR